MWRQKTDGKNHKNILTVSNGIRNGICNLSISISSVNIIVRFHCTIFIKMFLKLILQHLELLLWICKVKEKSWTTFTEEKWSFPLRIFFSQCDQFTISIYKLQQQNTDLEVWWKIYQQSESQLKCRASEAIFLNSFFLISWVTIIPKTRHLVSL